MILLVYRLQDYIRNFIGNNLETVLFSHLKQGCVISKNLTAIAKLLPMIQKSQDRNFVDFDERNNTLMTLRTVKFYCKKQSQYYDHPQYIQSLYLDRKGFMKIISQTLNNYTNLTALHLNNNGITKIQGLDSLKKLNVLILNNNFIQKVEGLDQLQSLTVLNLAHNKIQVIEGLERLQKLLNLNLSQNFITTAKDIQGLCPLQNLIELNLSQNQIQPSQQVLSVFGHLQNVTTLFLKSTPISSQLKNYRKRFIHKLKKLKFLDKEAVTEKNHALADAWMEGGSKLEAQMKQKIIDEKREKDKNEAQKQKIIKEQRLKQYSNISTSLKPIVYEKSYKQPDKSGLNCAYIPKKQDSFSKMFECSPNLPSKQTKPNSKK